jgi:hypothetical protein
VAEQRGQKLFYQFVANMVATLKRYLSFENAALHMYLAHHLGYPWHGLRLHNVQ